MRFSNTTTFTFKQKRSYKNKKKRKVSRNKTLSERERERERIRKFTNLRSRNMKIKGSEKVMKALKKTLKKCSTVASSFSTFYGSHCITLIVFSHLWNHRLTIYISSRFSTSAHV